jgi:hypothetical protein
MIFKCSNCDYSSDLKSNVKNHINKKNKCSDDAKIIEIQSEIICEHCNKKYSTLPNLKRHLKKCSKNDFVNQKTMNGDGAVNVMGDFTPNTKFEKNCNNNEVNNTQNNNNMTVNMYLNSYDNTDYSKISDSTYKQILGKNLMIVPKMIESVHCNKNIPENHNVYINNKNGKYAMVYNGEEWEIKNKEHIVDKLIFNNEYAIEEWIHSINNEDMVEKFNKYIETKEKTGSIGMIKEEIKMLLYNKRNIIKKTN